MASSTSWTQRAARLLPVPPPLLLLLALLVVCGSASAAVVRGQRPHAAANNEEAGSLNPLALLVLRAMAAEDAAPAPVLESAAGADDLAGLVDAAVSSARSSSSRAAAVPDAELADTAFLRAAKRQVRYHQCYFNPITCYG